MAAPIGAIASIATPNIILRPITDTRVIISVAPRPERPRMIKASHTQIPLPCTERPSPAGDTVLVVSKQLDLDPPVPTSNNTLLARQRETLVRLHHEPSTSSTTALVALTAHENLHGLPIGFLTKNHNTVTVMFRPPVVTQLLYIKIVLAMPIQERLSALARSIVTKIAALSVEVLAFAVAVKTDTTTT
jgi:hypothetical protein